MVGSIWINERWYNNHGRGNNKGKVNGHEVSDALAMLGIIVLTVMHVVNK